MVTTPSPQPPGFMFGTGIASNSSSAAPTLGVFVRSDQQYGPGQIAQQPVAQAGWNNPSSTGTTQIPPPVKNGGIPGITGAANDATAQPTPAPQPTSKAPLSTNDALNALGTTQSENVEESGEESAPLSNALSMFSSPDVEDKEEQIEQDDVENIDSEPEEAEPIEIEDEKLEETEPSEIESTDTLDSDDKGQEPAEEIEWGAWDEEIDEDLESKDIVPGLGPQSDGEILKPLPGTKEGESGWYFDTDGKPALWSFEPIGWEKKD